MEDPKAGETIRLEADSEDKDSIDDRHSRQLVEQLPLMNVTRYEQT